MFTCVRLCVCHILLHLQACLVFFSFLLLVFFLHCMTVHLHVAIAVFSYPGLCDQHSGGERSATTSGVSECRDVGGRDCSQHPQDRRHCADSALTTAVCSGAQELLLPWGTPGFPLLSYFQPPRLPKTCLSGTRVWVVRLLIKCTSAKLSLSAFLLGWLSWKSCLNRTYLLI